MYVLVECADGMCAFIHSHLHYCGFVVKHWAAWRLTWINAHNFYKLAAFSKIVTLSWLRMLTLYMMLANLYTYLYQVVGNP